MMLRTLVPFLLAVLFSPGLLRAGDILPSRDPRVVIPLLAQTSGHESVHDIECILGRPDDSFVSGFHIYVFRLDDATSVYVASPDRHRVFSLRRSVPGDNAVTLDEPLGDDLDHRVPTSAPF
jgi:hypothetical protein